MKIDLTLPSEIYANVNLPASKSISNRMLIIQKLSGGKIKLSNISQCDDTFVMEKALEMPLAVTDIKAAGTAMRFLTAYFANSPIETTMTGTERMRNRPIDILVKSLRSVGADISYMGRDGFPPIHIKGKQLPGGTVSMPGNVSSQFISAMLMVAPAFKHGVTIIMQGKVVSRPYINITLNLMRQFGIRIEEPDRYTFVVYPGNYGEGSYTIESDWSAASYWYEMLALADKGEITLNGLYENSLQGDSCVKELFEPLGIKTTFSGDNKVVLTKQAPIIEKYEADLNHCPDLAQTMAATCCAMNIPFSFSGLQNLRIKESDRLMAMKQELATFGYDIDVLYGNTLRWTGKNISPNLNYEIFTHEDHRMAMSLAPLAIKTKKLTINDPHVVSKSYPGFWNELKQAGATIYRSAK